MTEIDLGPPVLVFRDDPLFNQGSIAAELALATLRRLEKRDADAFDEVDASHATERLEAFLKAVQDEAAERAKA